MKPRIHYTKPSITSLELDYAADAAANGWGTNAMNTFIDLKKSLKNI